MQPINFSQLPKIDLHLHLDCSLSLQVVQKIDPTITEEAYYANFVAPKKCINLKDFLDRAVSGSQLMQTVEAISVVVHDLFSQLQQDNTLYAEIRFAPHLHLLQGLTPFEVVQAAEKATAEAVKNTGIEARLILCTLRHFSAQQSVETVQLVEQFAGTYVAGFDIAGDEAGCPVDNHIAAFTYAQEKGLHITAHAGEAKGAESVWEVLQHFGPSRIGHGVRSIEDGKLLDYLKQHNIHLELCPNCNVSIDIYDTYQQHPIDKLYKNGVSINVNTDNRAVTPITITQEYEKLHQHFGWEIADFYQCSINAIKAAFISDALKTELIEKLTIGYNIQ
jgi:adenosine deaminase